MRLALLAFLALLLVCALAQAQETEEETPDAWRGCWTRVYDAAHLAKHPGQNVTAMTLAISAREPAGDNDPGKYLAKITAKMRNTGDTYTNLNGARCAPAGGLLACVTDGFYVGKFSLVPAAKSLRLTLKGDEHLALIPGVDLESFILLSPDNPEHALFSLNSAPAKACGQ